MGSRILLVVASVVTLVATSGFAVAAEPSGEEVFKAKCATCHSLTPGLSTIAPDLHGVVGRKAASLDNFKYSDALEQSGIVWTPEKLDEWIKSPHMVAAETEMSFAGLSDPQERAAVVEFLKGFGNE